MIANIIRSRSKTAIGGGGGGIVIDNGDPFYSAVSLLLPMDGTNGSTTFTDSGPNALAVTAVGNAQISTTQSKYGGASAYFDGAGNAVQIPFNAALDLTSGDFTIEGWVYFNAVSGTPTIITPFGTGTAFGGWVIALDSSSRLTFYLSTTVNTWNLASNVLFSATAVVTGTWYHFALVRNGSTFKPYLNGIAGTTFTSSSTLYNNSKPLKIGAEKDSNVFPLNGYIDDLRISRFARYTSTFTPPTAALPTTASSTPADPYYGQTSLLLHMDGSSGSTNFVDSGPNAITVTAVGNAQISTTQVKYGSASGYFDGTGDFLSISDSAAPVLGSSDWTIEAWIYVSVAKNFNCFYAKRQPGYYGFALQVNGANTLTISASINGSSWVLPGSSLGSGYVAGVWTHVAVVRSGNTITGYKNGVSTGTQTLSGTIWPSTGYVAAVASGLAGDTSQDFNGYIDDLRITKYARYTSAFAPPAQALPNIYNPYASLPVSGAALWLDASQQSSLYSDAGFTPVTTSGQSIYQWNDLSGNNRHAIQATSGNRPTWVPPASGQNGLGAVGFNGATTFLSIADTAGLQFGTGDFTLFFAGVNSDVSRGSAYANTFISKGYTNIEFYQYQGLIQGYIGGTSNSPTTGSGTVSNNSSYVAHMIRSSGSTYVAANNVSGTPVTNTANANGSGTNINIGSRSPFNTTLTYLGSMYEILAFNRALSPTEITSVQSYLKTKWGTP